MSEKRRGLGKGLGALIPSGPQAVSQSERPVDMLFRERKEEGQPAKVRHQSGNRNPLFPLSTLQEDEDAEQPAAEVPARQASPRPRPERKKATTTRRKPAEAKVPAAIDPPTPPVDEPNMVAADDVSRETTGAPQDDLQAVPGAQFAQIKVTSIHANPRQPRTVFDEEALEELRQSILQVGVLQPVVVRTVGDEGAYELIMGERRWRASQAAGLTTIPAIVRDTSDDDLLRDALLENLHRSNLNPLEEAAAYDQLLTDFGCTHEELATRIGRSRPQISNTMRLLKLPPLVQRRVAAGVLSAGHARALLSLADGAAMERLAQRIVAEGLSVRATEEIVTLAEEPQKAPKQRRAAAPVNTEALEAITTRLSDVLETRVSAAMSRKKGKLTIEFADLDDLNRILSELTPDAKGQE